MTKASVTMMVRKGITVVRDGKRVRPEIGKTFDFTATERDDIIGADAAALGKVEGGEQAGTAEVASTSEQAGKPAKSSKKSSAEASQAAARGGKKAATANKSDDEAAAGEGGEGGGEAEDDL